MLRPPTWRILWAGRTLFSMTVFVRPATLDDLPALVALAQTTFPDAAPDDLPGPAVDSFIRENLGESNFRDFMTSDDWRVNVAVVQDDAAADTPVAGLGAVGLAPHQAEGTLIGYTLLGLDTENNPEQVAGAAYLSKFYLAVESRGTGAAKAMMDRVFDDARELGFTSVWLGTAKANHRANGFYTKAGFEIVGEREFPLTETVLGEDYIRLAIL